MAVSGLSAPRILSRYPAPPPQSRKSTHLTTDRQALTDKTAMVASILVLQEIERLPVLAVYQQAIGGLLDVVEGQLLQQAPLEIRIKVPGIQYRRGMGLQKSPVHLDGR